MATELDEYAQEIQYERLQVEGFCRRLDLQKKVTKDFLKEHKRMIEVAEAKLTNGEIIPDHFKHMMWRIIEISINEVKEILRAIGFFEAEIEKIEKEVRGEGKAAKALERYAAMNTDITMLDKEWANEFLKREISFKEEVYQPLMRIQERLSYIANALSPYKSITNSELMGIVKGVKKFFNAAIVAIGKLEENERKVMEDVLHYYKMRFDVYRYRKVKSS